MANPLFKDSMVFKAEKHFHSGTREYSEIHWSDFWWEIQVPNLLDESEYLRNY